MLHMKNQCRSRSKSARREILLVRSEFIMCQNFRVGRFLWLRRSVDHDGVVRLFDDVDLDSEHHPVTGIEKISLQPRSVRVDKLSRHSGKCSRLEEWDLSCATDAVYLRCRFRSAGNGTSVSRLHAIAGRPYRQAPAGAAIGSPGFASSTIDRAPRIDAISQPKRFSINCCDQPIPRPVLDVSRWHHAPHAIHRNLATCLPKALPASASRPENSPAATARICCWPPRAPPPFVRFGGAFGGTGGTPPRPHGALAAFRS